MSNMSYCRFHNTSRDLIDCRDAFQEFTEGSGTLSRDELEAAAQLILTAAAIVQSFSYLANVDMETVAVATPSTIRKILEKQQAENVANAEAEDDAANADDDHLGMP